MRSPQGPTARPVLGRAWIVVGLFVSVAAGAALLARVALHDPGDAAGREPGRGASAVADPAGEDGRDGAARDGVGEPVVRPQDGATGAPAPSPAWPRATGDHSLAPRAPGGASAGAATAVTGKSAPAATESAAPVAAGDDSTGAGVGTTTGPSPGGAARTGAPRPTGTAADAAPRVLTVVVKLAESGLPLAGADIRVTDAGGFDARARTTSDGSATLTLPSGGPFQVEAKSRNRVRVRLDDVEVAARGSKLSFVLERGVVVQGTVRGPRGGVEGALVRAYRAEPWRTALPYGPDPAPVAEATTARHGRYSLDSIPRGVECVIVASSFGCVDAVEGIEPQPDPDYVERSDLELEAGATLDGIVEALAEDGTPSPVEGARVVAVERSLLEDLAWSVVRRPDDLSDADKRETGLLESVVAGRRYEGARPACAVTGADGRFGLVVPATVDAWHLLALHPSAGRSAPSREVRPGHGPVALVMRGRSTAKFEVLAPDGRRAAGVTVRPYLPWESWTARLGPDGLFGPVDIDEGVALQRIASGADAPGDYVGHRIDEKRVVWVSRLDTGVQWAGRVRDDLGRAVAGATVWAGPHELERAERVTTTDEKGRFVLAGVRPDDEEVWAKAPRFVTFSDLVEEDRRSEIELTLQRTAQVRLRLRLPAGAPVPTWRRVSPPTTQDAEAWDRTDEFEWKDGLVEWPGWDPSLSSARVFVPGYEVVEREVAASADRPTDLGTVALVPATRIRGRVVDESMQAVAGAEVRIQVEAVWGRLLPVRSADTDGSGIFELELSAPQERNLLVGWAPGFVETPDLLVVAGGEPLLLLSRGRTYRGRLRDAASPASWTVGFYGVLDQFLGEAQVQEDGSFECVLARKPWRIVASSWERRERGVRAVRQSRADLEPETEFEISVK